MTTVEVVNLENNIYREPIDILEELNDQIHETLANMLSDKGKFNKTNSPIPSDEVVILNTCYKLFFLFCMFFI
jgi:hypothetical protein